VKILVWQTAFLGDLILSTSLISGLKKLYSQSLISVICKDFGRDVFKFNPQISEVIIYEKNRDSFRQLIVELKKKDFDLAICPHRSHRASLGLFLARIPHRIGFKQAGFSFLFSRKVEHSFLGQHEIERNQTLLTPLGDDGPASPPRLYLKSSELKFINRFDLQPQKYVVLAPGSKWPTKRWTKQGFAEVSEFCVQKGFIPVLIGSKEEAVLCKQIKAMAKVSVLNLAGKLNLRECFALIAQSRLVCSNDSAPVHMAVALNRPVVAIFGPTVKRFGFYPYQNGVVVERNDLSCRPCGLHGHLQCPQKHHHCMQKITSYQVIQAMDKFLEKDLCSKEKRPEK